MDCCGGLLNVFFADCIHIPSGDRVKIELSPYDLYRGRIIYRYK